LLQTKTKKKKIACYKTPNAMAQNGTSLQLERKYTKFPKSLIMVETPRLRKMLLYQWRCTNITHPSQKEFLASKTNYVLESWNIQTNTKRRHSA